jgi:hypothetical protein
MIYSCHLLVGIGTSTVTAVGYCNWRTLTECLVINFHYVINDVQQLYAARKNKLPVISLKILLRRSWARPYSQANAISDSIFHYPRKEKKRKKKREAWLLQNKLFSDPNKTMVENSSGI